MPLRMNHSAERVSAPGILGADERTSSIATSCKREKTLSSTRPATEGSRRAYSRLATEPMERPHNPTQLVRPRRMSHSLAMPRSAISRAPSVTYSPSDLPEPAKSSATTQIFCGNSSAATSLASQRQPELPCA